MPAFGARAAARAGRIIRPLGNGCRTYLLGNTFAGGTSQRSQTNRFPVLSNGKVYRAKVRLHLFWQGVTTAGTPTAPFVDTLFPNALNFQFGIKPGYENALTGLSPRTLFPFLSAPTGGFADHFEYPGAAAWQAAAPGVWFVDSDWVTLDGNTLFDLWSTVVVPASINPIPASALPLNRLLSNAMPRSPLGNIAAAAGANSAADHIALGFARNGGVTGANLTMTASTAVAATGGQSGFAPAMLIVETDAGVRTALIGGTSHAEGIDEGTASDVFQGVSYSDAFGDANGCRGMWEAGVYGAGWNYLNMGMPSDWEGRLANTHQTAADASQGWRAILADLRFDHIVWEHVYNDVAKSSYIGTYPAAGTSVKYGQTCRQATTGRMLVCVGAGTTTAGTSGGGVTTAAQGDRAADGGVTWIDVGAYSVNMQTAVGAFGGAVAGSRLLDTLFPGVPVTRNLPLPTGGQALFANTSLTASGTTITAVTADTSLLQTGEQISINNASTGYGGTATITVLDATHYTYTVASAPGTSPAAVPGSWTDNLQSVAGQTVAGPFGTGGGAGTIRGNYVALLAAFRNVLVNYVGLTDPGQYVENDPVAHDGKIKAVMGAPFAYQNGSHLTGYSASICKQVLNPGVMGTTA